MAEASALTRRSRSRLLLAVIAYGAFLAGILLWPSGSFPMWVAMHTAQALADVGLPASVVAGGRVEVALNAAMVVPLVLAAAVLWPRWGWERWTAYAFVASCSVELLQGLFLPMRSAQFADVVANTVGAAAGAVLGRLLGRRAD